jgi:RNA polymerase sigma factor (TIGR02999 family)
MSGPDRTAVTQLLNRWQDGDESALDGLLPSIYAELERLARAQLHRDFNASIQPTELVAEAYLRLIDVSEVDFASRAHFFSIAARVMRRVLVDRFRRRQADKRGGGHTLVTLDQFSDAQASTPVELERLNNALDTLESLDARQAEIVNLRFFGGLQVAEVAEVLSISERTVKREWAAAKLWLHREIAD